MARRPSFGIFGERHCRNTDVDHGGIDGIPISAL